MDTARLTSPARPLMSMAQILERIRRDAAAGMPLAHRTLAWLSAGGLGVSQSWTLARQSLEKAAALGSEEAAKELATLECGGAPTRVESGLVREGLSASPHVERLRRLIPPAWCEWIIGRARGRTSPALIYGASGAGERHARRSNSLWSIPVFEMDTIIHATRARIAAVIGVPSVYFEPTQILRYETGQAFDDHVDFLDPAHPDTRARGNRQDTVLVYLNDRYEGAETAFPRLDLAFRGGPGDSLWFRNLDAAGQGDPRTLHAGRAPTAGEKWIISQWVRSRPQLPPA